MITGNGIKRFDDMVAERDRFKSLYEATDARMRAAEKFAICEGCYTVDHVNDLHKEWKEKIKAHEKVMKEVSTGGEEMKCIKKDCTYYDENMEQNCCNGTDGERAFMCQTGEYKYYLTIKSESEGKK